MYGTKQLNLINFLQFSAIKSKELNQIKKYNKNAYVENCREYIYIYIYRHTHTHYIIKVGLRSHGCTKWLHYIVEIFWDF